MKEIIIKIVEELTGCKGINSQTDLFEEDILDSLAFVELVTELENTFNVEIQPTQVSSDTWKTVCNIAKMVETKMKKK